MIRQLMPWKGVWGLNLLRLGPHYSRGIRRARQQPLPSQSLFKPHYTKSINLTLSAMMQIENRKEVVGTTYFQQLGWQVSRQGHIVELYNKLFEKDIYVVFTSKNYPVEQPKAPQDDEQVSPQQIQKDESQRQKEWESQSQPFRVYLKQPQSPTYLVVQCLASIQGVGNLNIILIPYSVNFTRNYHENKLNRETTTWNQLDDMNNSTTHFLKRFLEGLAIDSNFGLALIWLSKECLRDQYKQWISDMRRFICQQ